LEAEAALEIVPGATHLFEEPGALDAVADLASRWFTTHLPDDGAHSSGKPEGDEKEWIPLAEAAAIAGCPEPWLMDRCRDGRLPSRPVSGSRLVPLTTVRALVAGRISE
jgi:hypothetical protein